MHPAAPLCMSPPSPGCVLPCTSLHLRVLLYLIRPPHLRASACQITLASGRYRGGNRAEVAQLFAPRDRKDHQARLSYPFSPAVAVWCHEHRAPCTTRSRSLPLSWTCLSSMAPPSWGAWLLQLGTPHTLKDIKSCPAQLHVAQPSPLMVRIIVQIAGYDACEGGG